eukprot:GHVS01088509.1.p1 GENE.GHVS01088509.1~~GHVS01088509.1.p1  ORF type:complete len:582 (+),score=106.19 GHVS01088509.1:918-2663(+)
MYGTDSQAAALTQGIHRQPLTKQVRRRAEKKQPRSYLGASASTKSDSKRLLDHSCDELSGLSLLTQRSMVPSLVLRTCALPSRPAMYTLPRHGDVCRIVRLKYQERKEISQSSCACGSPQGMRHSRRLFSDSERKTNGTESSCVIVVVARDERGVFVTRRTSSRGQVDMAYIAADRLADGRELNCPQDICIATTAIELASGDAVSRESCLLIVANDGGHGTLNLFGMTTEGIEEPADGSNRLVKISQVGGDCSWMRRVAICIVRSTNCGRTFADRGRPVSISAVEFLQQGGGMFVSVGSPGCLQVRDAIASPQTVLWSPTRQQTFNNHKTLSDPLCTCVAPPHMFFTGHRNGSLMLWDVRVDYCVGQVPYQQPDPPPSGGPAVVPSSVVSCRPLSTHSCVILHRSGALLAVDSRRMASRHSHNNYNNNNHSSSAVVRRYDNDIDQFSCDKWSRVAVDDSSSVIAVVNREQRVVKMWDAQRGGRPIGCQPISARDVEYLCDEFIFVGAEQEDLTAANSPQHFDLTTTTSSNPDRFGGFNGALQVSALMADRLSSTTDLLCSHHDWLSSLSRGGFYLHNRPTV